LDHNWGRTLFSAGLGNAGATLGARLLTAPWIVFTNSPGVTVGGHRYWITFPDTDLPWQEYDWPAGGKNFPYGLENVLEPDGPV